MKKIFIIIFFFGLLTACATPYQKAGFDGGYSDLALSRDTYKVKFRGNGYTYQDDVQAFLLRRCAELTLQHGYKYFVLLNSGTNADQSLVTTLTTIRSDTNSTYAGSGNIYGHSYSSYGHDNYATNTIIQPGRTYVVTRYSTTVIMRMLPNNKKSSSAFDATIILSNFKNIQ